MGYTFAIVNHSVIVTLNSAPICAIQGLVTIDVFIPRSAASVGNKTWFTIYSSYTQPLKVAKDNIDLIDGVAPDSTTAGVLLQLAQMFIDAYSGAGGAGNGSIIVSEATTSTTVVDAAIENYNVLAIVIGDSTLKTTGYTKVPASDTLTLTDGSTMEVGEQVTLFVTPAS